MHPFLIAALLLTPAGALARDDAAVSVPNLIANPLQRKGDIVVIRRIRCADENATIVCAAVNGQRALRIEARVIGAATTVAIAEKLIGPCKGAAKLDTPACTFDALITPKGSWQADGTGGPGSVTVIFSEQIELYTPRRI